MTAIKIKNSFQNDTCKKLKEWNERITKSMESGGIGLKQIT